MLVAAHEVGHNFGMRHDSDCSTFCNAKGAKEKCDRDGKFITSAGGKHVMWPTSVDGSDANNDVFSECRSAFFLTYTSGLPSLSLQSYAPYNM